MAATVSPQGQAGAGQRTVRAAHGAAEGKALSRGCQQRSHSGWRRGCAPEVHVHVHVARSLSHCSGVGVGRMRRPTVLVLLIAAALASAQEEEGGHWIQHFDKESGKQ